MSTLFSAHNNKKKKTRSLYYHVQCCRFFMTINTEKCAFYDIADRRFTKMLLNFCDPRLRAKIKCNAISTDEYEVTNLINGSSKGYMAYSCIKPPIDIEITFFCNVCINHILIWPSVGSQRSSGFRLCGRTDECTAYTQLSSAFLTRQDAGLLFYPNDGSVDCARIPTPANFARRGINASKRSVTGHARALRVSIFKTENSVPALGKIEVWGTVSSQCDRSIVATVNYLWNIPQEPSILPVTEVETDIAPADQTPDTKDNRLKSEAEFKIPESFLDVITWELMTQPIILPCGQIIDQTTLEKFGDNEAKWGRSLSDPFTGLQFNDDRRPVMASALKLRIDKFLLENSGQNEVQNEQRMPRVLGRDPAVTADRGIIEVPRCALSSLNLKRRTAEDDIRLLNIRKQMRDNNSQPVARKYCHNLPVPVMPSYRPTANAVRQPRQLRNVIQTSSELARDNSQNDNNDELGTLTNNVTGLENLFSPLRRVPQTVELHKIANNCECCTNSAFYRLPCKHVICRKVLLSIENNQCKFCGFSYKSCEIERVDDNI